VKQVDPARVCTLERVLQTGSFAAAGRELGYSASAVSQQIAALEHATGLVLFERTAHAAHPTAAAQRLVELARPALLAQQEFAEQLAALARRDLRKMQIGAFPSAAATVIPHALALLRKRHPDLVVSLHEGEPDDVVPRLSSGALDLALVYEHPSARRPWPAGVQVDRVAAEPLLLAVPGGHRLAARERVDIGELRSEPWIASHDETGGARALRQLCSDAGFDPRISHQSNDYQVVLALVREGYGIAAIPSLGRSDHDGVSWVRLSSANAVRWLLIGRRRGDLGDLPAAGLEAVSTSIHAWLTATDS
jgi:DNA-binding transcriptional LysR family regulator